MLPERSGGNVSYAQHVIFGDPSEHFFVGGTFAHPLHVSLRARVRVRVRVAPRPDRATDKERRIRPTRLSVSRAGVLVAWRKCIRVCRSILLHVYPLLYIRFARRFCIYRRKRANSCRSEEQADFVSAVQKHGYLGVKLSVFVAVPFVFTGFIARATLTLLHVEYVNA